MLNVRQVFTTYSPIYTEAQQERRHVVKLHWWQNALVALGLIAVVLTGANLGQGQLAATQTSPSASANSSETTRQLLITSVTANLKDGSGTSLASDKTVSQHKVGLKTTRPEADKAAVVNK